MTDVWLAEYIDKVLSAGPGSAGRIAAPFVTNALALKVHNLAQKSINWGIDYIYIPIVCDYTF